MLPTQWPISAGSVVEVVLRVETRGPEHCGEVIGALRAAGYILAFA
jgi:hypothetical protein